MFYSKDEAKIKVDYENAVCSWECAGLKIVFSNPSIQPYQTMAHIKSANDFMYYYYDVDVYRETYQEDMDGECELTTMEKVISTKAFDFPGIFALQRMLEHVLSTKKPDDTYMTVEYTDGQKDKTTVIDNNDFFAEDVYSITKTFTENGRKFYKIGVGETRNCNNGITQMLTTCYIPERPVKGLKVVVDEFINCSIIHFNKCMEQEIQELPQYRETIDDDILVIIDSYDNDREFFFVGQTCETLEFVKKENNKNKMIELSNVTIEKIENGEIIFSHKDKVFTVNPNDIYYLCKYDVDEEKLSYNEQQIIDDFKEIILKHPTLYNDFKYKNIEKLYELYNGAIANRTWMFREEHKYSFEMKANEEHNDYVQRVILFIIEELKKEIA